MQFSTSSSIYREESKSPQKGIFGMGAGIHNGSSMLSYLSNEELMEQIEEKYLQADFDECMNLIDRRFQGLRTYFNSPPQGSSLGSGRMLHACYRNPSCDCVVLTQYLISIAFHRQETDLTAFLQTGGFLHEAELRMPFAPFTEWLQLEIHRGNYERADDLLRQYIFESTRLKVEESTAIIGQQNGQQDKYYKDMFGGMRKGQQFGGGRMMGSGGFSVNAKDLPLSKNEYYELLELLVFFIWLPSKGYDVTMRELRDLPMPKELRSAFESRLGDIRNTAVADLKITNAEKILSLKPSSQSHISTQLISEAEQESLVPPESISTTKVEPSQKSVREKRVKQGLIAIAALVILFSLVRYGILKKIIVDYLLKSRFMRWLLLLLFNYRFGNKQTALHPKVT